MKDPPKLYVVSFKERPEYLYAFIKGDLSLSPTKVECWDKIIRRCREKEYTRLLVVLDGPGNSTELDAYESSRGIIDLGLDGIKIAYVDLDAANYTNNQFGELVADNRGVFAKVFTTESDAHDWLTAQKK